LASSSDAEYRVTFHDQMHLWDESASFQPAPPVEDGVWIAVGHAVQSGMVLTVLWKKVP